MELEARPCMCETYSMGILTPISWQSFAPLSRCFCMMNQQLDLIQLHLLLLKISSVQSIWKARMHWESLGILLPMLSLLTNIVLLEELSTGYALSKLCLLVVFVAKWFYFTNSSSYSIFIGYFFFMRERLSGKEWLMNSQHQQIQLLNR